MYVWRGRGRESGCCMGVGGSGRVGGGGGELGVSGSDWERRIKGEREG